MFMSNKSLEQCSLKELVIIYNEIAEANGENTVNRFPDKPSAIKRVQKLQDLYKTKTQEDDVYSITLNDGEGEFTVEANTVEELQHKYDMNAKWQMIGKNFLPVYKNGEGEPFTVLFTLRTQKN